MFNLEVAEHMAKISLRGSTSGKVKKMRFRVRCVKSGRTASAMSSPEAAERIAAREGFVKIDGKWYFKKEFSEGVKHANPSS